MKNPIIGCLIMLLVPAVAANAQDQPFNQSTPVCCSNYESTIVNPPRGIDFKIIIIVPPKDFDQAMVLNPCPEMQTSPPKVSVPDYPNGAKQFFKLPPFTVTKSSDRIVHLWN